jgi:AcrR family transcriptional regulator
MPAKPAIKETVRRSAKWEQRRKAIVDTSASVFAQRGYHATSTQQLCEVNRVGKGALYYYIGSKEKLLVAIHDRVMDEVMLGADRVAEKGGSPAEQLASLGEELLEVIFRYPDHVWVFLHEFPALTGANDEEFRRRRREYEKRIEQVFADGNRSGTFRRVEPRTAAKAWLGMHNYTYLWLRGGGRYSVKELAANYADIFVWGVSSGVRPAQKAAERKAPAPKAKRARRTA